MCCMLLFLKDFGQIEAKYILYKEESGKEKNFSIVLSGKRW